MAVSDWIPFPRETLVERIARPSEVRRVIRASDGWYLHGWTDAVRLMPTNAGEWRWCGLGRRLFDKGNGMEVTIESMVERWKSAKRPLFKGKLIDDDGCKCAQGDVLSCCGVSDDELRRMAQHEADRRTAQALGISVLHAVLLRWINDKKDGCPQDVLADPEKVLGPHADLVLAFWLHLETVKPEQWAHARASAWGVEVAFADAATAAGEAAGVAMKDSWAVVGGPSRSVAGATHELQGWSKLTTKPCFLPLFGIDDPAAWVANVQNGKAVPNG